MYNRITAFFRRSTQGDKSNRNRQLSTSAQTGSLNRQELDLVLFGKTGHGKSATGNSILRRDEFEISHDVTSKTLKVDQAWVDIGDYTVKVVDGPGIAETRLSNAEAKKKACSDMSEAMARCPKGFHALLLVLKFGNRFTEEEQDAITMLKLIFGEDIIRDYCVIVVTHGENFDLEDETDFTDWLSKQTGAMKDLITECNQRCVLFRNSNTTGNDVKERQRIELLQIVESLKYRDVRYTNDLFKRMEKSREKLVVQARLPHLKDNVLKQTSLILSGLKSVEKADEDPAIAEETLVELEKYVFQLEEEINAEDRGTQALDELRDMVSHVKENLKLQRYVTKERAKLRQQEKQLKEENQRRINEMNKQKKKELEQVKEQLQYASEAERARELQKVQDFEIRNREEESNLIRKCEQDEYELRQKHMEKLKNLETQLKSSHDNSYGSLKQKYERMNKEAADLLQNEITTLQGDLDLLAYQAAFTIKLLIRSEVDGDSVASTGLFQPLHSFLVGHYYLFNIPEGSRKFFYDGVELKPTDTPKALGLPDEAIIHVHPA